MSTVYGPTVGSFLLVVLGEYLRANYSNVIPGFHLIIYGLAVVLVILYYPNGIFVAARDIFTNRVNRKKTITNNITSTETNNDLNPMSQGGEW